MEIDRVSFLIGLVLGLAFAAIVIAGAIVLAPRSQTAGAAALTSVASPTRLALTPTLPPSPSSPTATATATATTQPSPTASATPPPPTATPTVRPTPNGATRYENLEVGPRRSVQLSIGAAAGQTLELSLLVDRDIDLTIADPTGTVVYGPRRVQRSYNTQLRCPAGGNYVIKLDNSFSIISTKQVMVQYRLLAQP